MKDRQLHIVHAGDHRGLVDAIRVIAQYQRNVQRLNVMRVSEAENATHLAELLTEPAAVVLFSGHGTPDGWIGTEKDWLLDLKEVKAKARQPFSAHGLIMDACYGWNFRDAVSRQSSRPLAYLAACGVAPYTDTLLIVNVAISLVGYWGKTLPKSAVDADDAFDQVLGSARGLWHHDVLAARP